MEEKEKKLIKLLVGALLSENYCSIAYELNEIFGSHNIDTGLTAHEINEVYTKVNEISHKLYEASKKI
jgi:hypothetical protein